MRRKIWKIVAYLTLVFGGYLGNSIPILGGVLVTIGAVILAYKL